MARTPSRHRAPRRLLGTLAVAGLAAVGCLYFPDEARPATASVPSSRRGARWREGVRAISS